LVFFGAGRGVTGRGLWAGGLGKITGGGLLRPARTPWGHVSNAKSIVPTPPRISHADRDMWVVPKK
jgi:hypothetical protein